MSLTGILATMPYIALQLVGIEAVLGTVGIGGSGNAFLRDLPLLVAFAVLAAYTYSSGLRAPALTAFVKDTLIYLTIAVAVVYFAVKIGYGSIFAAAARHLNAPGTAGSPVGVFIPGHSSYWAYATLVLGAALAQLMYPHATTAVLSARNPQVLRRNAATLPVYTLLLCLLALLGFAGLATGTSVAGSNGRPNPQLVVPHLFAVSFPAWFTGIAFAAIAIGALVPAAIMSIAAANLFTRNVYREFIRPRADAAHEARVWKLASLVVKFGALAFILLVNSQDAVNLQLLGGIWILQCFVAVVAGLYTRWLHRWALLAGWVAAMAYGTIAAYHQSSAVTAHFGGSLATFPFTHTKVYIALTAAAINLIVSVAGTMAFRLARVPAGTDRTTPADYRATPVAADGTAWRPTGAVGSPTLPDAPAPRSQLGPVPATPEETSP